MKKLLSILFAVLFVFSAATVMVSALGGEHKIERDDKGIIMMDFLDFNPDMNSVWATQNADGSWSCTITAGNEEYPMDEDYNVTGPFLGTSFKTDVKWSFSEGGEALHVELVDTNSDGELYETPGLAFVLDDYHDRYLPIGTESGSTPKAEYVKIRVRNTSTAGRFTFGFMTNNTGTGGWKFVNMSVSDLTVDKDGKEYESATGEWQTYIVSMPTINTATNYNDGLAKDSQGNPLTRWGGELGTFVLFPFGYDVTDGTGGYFGASIDIDYVVIGSLDYVTNYKSALETKEENITKLELVSEPTKKEYHVGETLDLTGLKLKATYKDGTTEELTSASYDANLDREADKSTVTLKFGPQSVTYDVKVVGVQSIEMIEAPEDTTFEISEVQDGFSPEGFTFRVNYTDGTSSEDFPASAFLCSGNFTTAGKQTITANFKGITTTFEVNIVDIVGLEITPKTTFRYNDKVSDSNLDITFVYSDGTKIASGDSNTTLNYALDVPSNKFGEVTGKITATNETYGVNVETEFTVTYDMPTALKVTNAPSKTVYQPGETLDTTGLEVALLYEDGKTVKLVLNEDYTVRADLNSSGEKKVNIKCSLEGLEKLSLDENLIVTVEGDVTESSATSATTRRPTQEDPAGISPVVIIVIVVAVVAIAGVVVFLVIKKKKK